MKNYIVTVGLVVVAGITGFIAGKHFEKNKKIAPQINSTDPDADKTQELRLGEYKLINPLLECDNYHPSKVESVVELESKVKKLIDTAKLSGRITDIAFYYRDLINGTWIGIGEKEPFTPASLLKVPIMIAAFKKAEGDPSFFKKKIKYEKNFNSGLVPNIKDSVIKIGNSYSIESLIYNMIVHSDNEARLLLLENIEQEFMNKVFSDLKIDMTGFDDNKDFMSAKTYSSFFRLLYNATYLNKDYSERALQILTKVQFHQGLHAYIPDNIFIAHKFGERGYANSNIRELHDCGIVYKGNSPYLICIMTKGTNTEEQTKIIAEISSTIYDLN